jgi:hypothetical protein
MRAGCPGFHSVTRLATLTVAAALSAAAWAYRGPLIGLMMVALCASLLSQAETWREVRWLHDRRLGALLVVALGTSAALQLSAWPVWACVALGAALLAVSQLAERAGMTGRIRR